MKFSTNKKFTRRQLAQAFGPAALALPFLDVLNSDVLAQSRPAGNFAKFAIFIYQPDGVYQRGFWPRGTENDFELSNILSPLNRHKDKMLLLGPQLDGNNHPRGNTGLTYATKPPQHTAPVCLTASTSKINLGYPAQSVTTVNNFSEKTTSVDQLIARRVQGDSQFLAMNLGTRPIGGDTVSDINYLDGVAQQRISKADEGFNRFFGSTMAAGNAAAAQEFAQSKNKAVTDFMNASFGSLRPRLGVDDRQALEQHLTSFSELEKQKNALIEGGGGGGCQTPERRPVPTDNDSIRSGADTEALLPFFYDVIVGGFRCNLSKVASMTLSYPGGGGAGGVRMPWLGFGDAVHGMSHHKENTGGNNSPVKRYSEMTKWWASQIAYLMDQLEAVPYEGGTLLDQTMIYWFNRHGDGNTHSNSNLPNIIFGGTGGHFNMGRFLKMDRTNPTNVLISLAQSMGLEDVNRFGVGGYEATGPLDGLRA